MILFEIKGAGTELRVLAGTGHSPDPLKSKTGQYGA
jgi:hypothetical protein